MLERQSEQDQNVENHNWEAVKKAVQKITDFLKDVVQQIVDIVRSFLETLMRCVDWKGLQKYLRRRRKALLRSRRNHKFLKRKRKHGRVRGLH